MLTGHAINKVHEAGFPEVQRVGFILQHVEDTGIRSIDLANKLSIPNKQPIKW